MAKSDYLDQRDRAFSQQLINFSNGIGAYATTLGLTAPEVAAQAADALRYKWELDAQELCLQCAQSWTMWKDITRNGGAYPVAGAPVDMPVPPDEPPAVAPGIEARFRALVRKLKAHANYNTSIGEALGIEGADVAAPDLATVKPLLKLSLVGGTTLVGWTWQGHAKFLGSVELQVDRGDGQGWRLLTIDTTPGYQDTQPMPATPQQWKYRGIYRVGDQRVGQWSDVASVNVGA
jgi:hypothetical protein